MHEHVLQPPETRSQHVDPADSPTVVTPVGTFAAGQSDQGEFHVAAEAEVGTFASGVADDRPWETA
jgi:hypothetical protein